MVEAAAELDRGRASYASRAWADAFTSLSGADERTPLAAADLDLLATAAYMVGREDDYFRALERCHHAHLEAGDPLRGARCAFWIGVNLARRGEVGRASGWLARAQRLVEHEAGDCVERGYLLIPVMFRHEAAGEEDEASAVAAEAASIGERFGDRDLLALAVHEQGHVLVRQGRLDDGVALLDEAMVAATGGELSPIVTGIVYCGVILACAEAFEARRAREWTSALTAWCEQQPEMVAFTGRCLLHRAEIMQLGGTWEVALAEAERAVERSDRANNRAAAAEAVYRAGEVRRLRGELTEAERAYREASARGREPQPGFALLRLAQGNVRAALAAIRRVAAETTAPLGRASLLPAWVEIMLAAGELGEARVAADELEAIAARHGGPMLSAMAAGAHGAVELAAGDATAALRALRRAAEDWNDVGAPYEEARVRLLSALACREAGDEDASALELEAARAAFERLGAAPDLARVDEIAARRDGDDAHGLTRRELEVLRLVAAGGTNGEIGATLVISEHTVARHLQNIFAKLGVSSRTAAGAFAHEHGLV